MKDRLLDVLALPGRKEPTAYLEDLIESRIEIHDSQHFEVKLDYSIDPHRKKNRYRVEMFLFSPLSLGVTPDTYSKKRFYTDIQAYIRFKTPAVPLAALLNPEDPDSPLARLAAALPPLASRRPGAQAVEGLESDMKLLGCLVRSHVRDRVAWCCRALRNLGGERMAEDLRSEAMRLVEELAATLHRFRGLRAHLLDAGLPARLRETHEFVDEYLSLSTEAFLTRLLQELDQGEAGAGYADLRRILADQLGGEHRYRGEAGYPTLSSQGDRSHFLWRRGLLKKFTMSVLFLEITKSREGNRLLDLFAAIAAGVSMAIATMGGFWAQQRFLNSTWPLLAALVLLYMVKDRTKEWLRSFFSKEMTRMLADWDVRIRDPRRGLDLGRCREAFGFLRREQVPPEVWAMRHQQARTSIEALGKPEVVIKYEKEVSLDGRIVEKLGGPRQELSDIIRFNLAGFLTQADDPTTPVTVYDPSRDRVETVDCPKVYHLNAIFVLHAEGNLQRSLEHVRVVLDKRGIQALEHYT